MNRYKLSKAGINAKEGIERFGGNMQTYEKFLYQFPDEPHFKQMREAIKAGDAKTAFAAAHSLKGEVGNLSINRLYQDLCPLVEALRAGSIEKANEFLEPVIQNYQEVIEALS